MQGYMDREATYRTEVAWSLLNWFPKVVREFIDHSPDKDKSDANLALDTAR